MFLFWYIFFCNVVILYVNFLFWNNLFFGLVILINFWFFIYEVCLDFICYNILFVLDVFLRVILFKVKLFFIVLLEIDFLGIFFWL